MQLEELVEIHQHVSITKRLKHYKTVISRITDEVSINDHEDIFSKLKAPSIKSTINEGA